MANADDLPSLFEIWETSVRATHLFLDETHIQTFIPLVRQELAHFVPLHCVRDAANLSIAFMGVADAKIEMLFVAPDYRCKGAGQLLTEYAIDHLGARWVDVNEQNEQAVGFYAHLGFEIIGRSEFDPFGNPFPILHLELTEPS